MPSARDPQPPTADTERTPPHEPTTVDSGRPDQVAISDDGFRIGSHSDDTHLDGERLFRQAVAPAPPRPPHVTPMLPLPDPAPDEDDPPPADGARVARIGGFIAIGFGILAFISTRDLPFPLFLIIGGAILAVYVGSPARLKREQVVDRWDCLINAGQGRGKEVVAATTAHIDSQRLPFVYYEQRELAASRLRGGTRPFLVITHQGNGRLRPYRMHVSVRDYGHNLQTSWFLTYHRSFFERLKPDPLVALNLFDEQDLRAYVTAVHHTFLDAVVDLMVALGQDTNKLERTSKGFLGIS